MGHGDLQKDKEKKAPSLTLGSGDGNFHPNVQVLPVNLLPAPDSGGQPVSHNLSKEVSRGSWKGGFHN